MNFKEAHLYLKTSKDLVLKASFYSEVIFLLFLASPDFFKHFKNEFDKLEGQI